MNKKNLLSIALLLIAPAVTAEVQNIAFGNMDHWVTRNITESKVLGGKQKKVYEIGPTAVINGAKPYRPTGGSPWSTSNVYAKVMGIVKTSNAVFPAQHPGHGQCARLTTMLEECKAMGIVNINVLVSGSIFLGEMIEPVSGTGNPYSKLNMGIPFSKRPKSLIFDYKMVDPGTGVITKASTGSKSTHPGHDSSDVFIYLQRRWEDDKGNIYAKRVGTGRKRFTGNTGWVNGYRIPIIYGDATKNKNYRSYMGLLGRKYYARNSKGKMVPVNEVGWDSPDATPTHMIVMASAGSGNAYEGQLGQELWVDNFRLEF